MKFRIHGAEYESIPIKAFRASYQLTESFGITQFEPKDFTGLGRIDKSGILLKQLREQILHVMPDTIQTQELMQFIDHIQLQFQTKLTHINHVIALKDVEVEYAVAGFGDILRKMTYKTIHAKVNQQTRPAFDPIYFDWIMDSLRISSQIHHLQHRHERWKIQVINHVFGRAGLQITLPDKVVYVADSAYLCPAEGFMYNLLRDIHHQIWLALA